MTIPIVGALDHQRRIQSLSRGSLHLWIPLVGVEHSILTSGHSVYCKHLVARAIRNAIRANRFARIIRN